MFSDNHYGLLRSFVRVRVTAPTAPPVSRTFDLSRHTSESQLIDAFLLTVGHQNRGEEHDYDSYKREVRSVVFGSGRTIDIPGIADDCWIEALGSRDSVVGEPCVQIVDEDDPNPASPQWQSAPAPLRTAHVQPELTRMFGIVLPEVDTSQFDPLPGVHGYSPLRALLRGLPPQRRLALRAHIVDIVLPDASALKPAAARLLLSGLSWLIDRLGPDGVDQNEHGDIPNWLAREAEAAMGWMPISGSPPSPGHALLALARSARFTRRLKGKIVTTVRGRAVTEKPLCALEDVSGSFAAGAHQYDWNPRDDWGSEYSHYRWDSSEARTLALLAVADDSGADTDGVVDQVVEGLRALEGTAGNFDEQDARTAALNATRAVMEVLAPLGGPGGYGMLTPPVRAFARSLLL